MRVLGGDFQPQWTAQHSIIALTLVLENFKEQLDGKGGPGMPANLWELKGGFHLLLHRTRP
jgi:hypothetical protein